MFQTTNQVSFDTVHVPRKKHQNADISVADRDPFDPFSTSNCLEQSHPYILNMCDPQNHRLQSQKLDQHHDSVDLFLTKKTRVKSQHFLGHTSSSSHPQRTAPISKPIRSSCAPSRPEPRRSRRKKAT